MNEKMADEELEQFKRMVSGDVAADDFECREWLVRAVSHIAALTAERDEAAAAETRAWEKVRTLVDEGLDLRARVQALEGEVERVRGVVREYRELVRDARQRVHAAESRLAAIRRRANEYRAGLREMDRDPSGPRTSRIYSVLDHILGDDASAPSEATVCAAPGCGDTKAAHHQLSGCFFRPPSELDGLRGGWFEARAEREDPAPVLPVSSLNPPAGFGEPRPGDEERAPTPPSVIAAARNAVGLPPLPTTSEAFAALKARRHWWAENGAGTPAGNEARQDIADLSLLERRMGAMEARIRDVAAFMDSEDYHDTARGLRSALTDAPPVFTLEEVRTVLKGRMHHKPLADVMKELAALRR